jgi:hypothetical protein
MAWYLVKHRNIFYWLFNDAILTPLVTEHREEEEEEEEDKKKNKKKSDRK